MYAQTCCDSRDDYPVCFENCYCFTFQRTLETGQLNTNSVELSLIMTLPTTPFRFHLYILVVTVPLPTKWETLIGIGLGCSPTLILLLMSVLMFPLEKLRSSLVVI